MRRVWGLASKFSLSRDGTTRQDGRFLLPLLFLDTHRVRVRLGPEVGSGRVRRRSRVKMFKLYFVQVRIFLFGIVRNDAVGKTRSRATLHLLPLDLPLPCVKRVTVTRFGCCHRGTDGET